LCKSNGHKSRISNQKPSIGN